MMPRARTTALALVLCATSATTLHAQARPDFSGVWTRAADSTAGRGSVAATGDAAFQRGDMGSGWGATLTIKQDASQLSVQYPYFSTYDLQPPILLEYKLDGSESKNGLNVGHTTSMQTSRAMWDGETLVITTRSTGPVGADGKPVPVEVKQAMSLQSPTVLRVVTTRAGILGAAATTTTVTYTKR
jgi:hypothetical protein